MYNYSSVIRSVGGIKSSPKEILSPLAVPQRRLLLGPGPSNLSPRVIKALSNPLLGHMHPETFKLMDEIKAGLQYAFQTENRLTLAISASGHSGMEACLANLLETGDRILIVKGGLWGERAENMSKRLGARVRTLNTELGVAFTLDQLEIAIDQWKPSVVFLAHSESSTALKQPLIGIGDICHRYEALLIVDTVASLGAEPFFMDAWKIDAAYTGSQKVFGAPPGLTPISFNARAEKKLFSRLTKVKSFYWDMIELGNYWNCFNEPVRRYHHTISATLLYGLREGLAQLIEEGLETSWKRHATAAKKLVEGLQSRELQLYIREPEHRLSTITSVVIPLGIDYKLVLRRLLEKWDIEISGGLGPTVGKIFRIGLMGINAREEVVDRFLIALDEVLTFAKMHSQL
ncbi:serine--pyruvate aminotransferase, mitochondrial [Chelonus insularis]|uniref:serine--pyruvate aminotransferase, mitochondrial n=1 Tax=Chelonus insularis TaxID=460826 RepID=UPI00158BE599|nr:serine--pyruvate aminotransferase, mitochondrial [Chelonus insularis]